MVANADPEPNLVCPEEIQTPVHSIQDYGLPTMPPNLLPVDQPRSPCGTSNVLQGGAGKTSGAYSFKPHIALERARLPMFSGNMRDYYHWKAEWEDLEKLENPYGLDNVRKFHLLGSLDEKVKRDLVLSSCGSTDDIFRLRGNKYGNKPRIVLLISKEVYGLLWTLSKETTPERRLN